MYIKYTHGGRDGRARPSVPVRAGAAAGGLDRLLCCPRPSSWERQWGP